MPDETPRAFAVLTELLEVGGARVLAAADATAVLAEHPRRLPAQLVGAECTVGGGAEGREGELVAAAAAFAQAWSAECSTLTHDTRRLGDALVTTAHRYRDVDWWAGSVTSRLLVAATSSGRFSQ